MTFKKYRKATAYDTVKNNKKANFIVLNKKYCKDNQTVLAGDSITEIFNMELFDEYTEAGGLLVYNRGISGDTSDRLLERFDETVLDLNPQNLVINIGTNDLTLISDVDYVFGNIKKAVEKAVAKNIPGKIIIQSVYPVTAKNKKKNQNIIKLNSKLKDFAEQTGIIYLDLFSLLLDEKGGLNEKYTYDGLHPNAYGFEIAAREIIRKLNT